jgi:hypothetical protein
LFVCLKSPLRTRPGQQRRADAPRVGRYSRHHHRQRAHFQEKRTEKRATPDDNYFPGRCGTRNEGLRRRSPRLSHARRRPVSLPGMDQGHQLTPTGGEESGHAGDSRGHRTGTTGTFPPGRERRRVVSARTDPVARPHGLPVATSLAIQRPPTWTSR